jgi:hypothetical protein
MDKAGILTRPRHVRAAIAFAAAVGLILVPAYSAAAAPAGVGRLQLHTIQPGRQPALVVKTPVNIVFVGYQPHAVDVRRLLAQLPASSDPIIRDPNYLYGIEQDVGLRFKYDFRTLFAGRAFDDAFFAHLASSGTVGGPDMFQTMYNDQEHNLLDVGPKVRYIDAPATEAWLERQAGRRLGIDPNQDTVFLVNWYGRADFQFHTYTHLGEVDPDTGIDGGLDPTGHVVAWGGGTGPTWFFDISAGPDDWSDNWNVDDADLNGDGVTEYRVPPIWEYGNPSAYRPFTDLSGDLGRVVRYVGLDLLFTPSPLFDPVATVPGPDGVKQITMNIFEGDPATNGLDDLHAAIALAQQRSLQPYYGVDLVVHDQPLAGDVLTAYNIAAGNESSPGCWDEFGVPFAELYCFFRDHRAQYFPPAGENSQIPIAGFTVTDDPIATLGFYGYTDDDWSTGAPSYIYELDTPSERAPGGVGLAYTALTIHEGGHFMGLSHPHDGYDSNTGNDFNPTGATDVAWLGDESASAMGYLPGVESFDVFDKVNLARWQTARLLDLANTDAAAIIAQPRNTRADRLLVAADADFAAALLALKTANWMLAAKHAADGYREVQRADAVVGVSPASTHFAAVRAAVASSVARCGDADPVVRTPTRTPLPTILDRGSVIECGPAKK